MDTPNNFLGIPEIDPRDADVLILPVPLEAGVSYGHGTKNGPEAILKASQQVELYDHELGYELQETIKIATLPHVELKKTSPELAQEAITNAVKEHTDKFLISLGGEHSITPALVKQYFKRFPDLSILHIDAHTDMRDQWDGSKWSHACSMRRCQEQGIKKIISVGVRNTAQSEQQYIDKDNIYFGDEFDVQEILEKLSDTVYLSFDVDGLDLPYMVATGTPEPGGISYKQALDIMKAVAQKKNLVGADFVELAPIQEIPAYDFLVAKLIFKLIGYKFRNYK